MPKVTASPIRYFSYKTSNVLPLLSRFPQPNYHCISTSWKWFTKEVYSRSIWFDFELTPFLGFYEKNLVKKKISINYFDEQKNVEYFSKYSGKKIKAIWAVLDYSKRKIFFVSKQWWPTFFQTSPCYPSAPPFPSNYFSVATVLNFPVHFWLLLSRWAYLKSLSKKWVYIKRKLWKGRWTPLFHCFRGPADALVRMCAINFRW